MKFSIRSRVCNFCFDFFRDHYPMLEIRVTRLGRFGQISVDCWLFNVNFVKFHSEHFDNNGRTQCRKDRGSFFSEKAPCLFWHLIYGSLIISHCTMIINQHQENLPCAFSIKKFIHLCILRIFLLWIFFSVSTITNKCNNVKNNRQK